MELLKCLILVVGLATFVACRKYDNPYDPENANKDFDGDGAKNKEDPDPRSKPPSTSDSGSGETIATPQETAGTGTGSVETPSDAGIKIEKWTISQPTVCSIAYRAADKSLYIFGNGKVSTYSVESGEPTPGETKTLDRSPSSCRSVAAWGDDGTYYLADNTHIYSYSADLDFIEPSIEMSYAFISASMGGGIVEGGGIRIITGTEYSGFLRDINLITGMSEEVEAEIPTPIGDGFIKVYDTLTTVAPTILWNTGFAKTSAGYWIVVRSSAYFLVLVNGGGVPIQAYPLVAANGTPPQHITSDGESIWALTANQLMRVTPP